MVSEAFFKVSRAVGCVVRDQVYREVDLKVEDQCTIYLDVFSAVNGAIGTVVTDEILWGIKSINVQLSEGVSHAINR